MKPFRTLLLLFIGNIVILYLAARVYGERFEWWSFPLSSLGGTVTMNGFPNAASRRLFDLDMIYSALLILVHGLQFRAMRSYGGSRLVSDLSFAAAVGFCIALSPHNLPFWGILHMIGAGTFVATIWIIGLVHILHLKYLLRIPWYRAMLVLHWGPLFAYAGLFFVQDPLNNGVQKIALVAVALMVTLSEHVVQTVQSASAAGFQNWTTAYLPPERQPGS